MILSSLTVGCHTDSLCAQFSQAIGPSWATTSEAAQPGASLLRDVEDAIFMIHQHYIGVILGFCWGYIGTMEIIQWKLLHDLLLDEVTCGLHRVQERLSKLLRYDISGFPDLRSSAQAASSSFFWLHS